MPKIIMLKGLPGSGKTTWAKDFVANNQGWIRVNKDDIRIMFGAAFSKKNEALVLRCHNLMIERALREAQNVVVDNTSFSEQHEKFIQEICDVSGYNVTYEVKMFDTPLEECILNDAKRPNPVGPKVIKKMWRQYVYKKPEPIPFIDGTSHAIICDLDGTLALHNGRSPYDTAKCNTDILCDDVASILINLVGRIIFVSGRSEEFREITKTWLDLNFTGKPYELYMRPLGDNREDSIVKEEIFNKYIRGRFNIRFVLDDRNRVVDMWRRIGLTCFQVADGDF